MTQQKFKRKAAIWDSRNQRHLHSVKPKKRIPVKWPRRWKRFGTSKINPVRDAWEEEVVLRAIREYAGDGTFSPRNLHESQPRRFRSARALLKIVVRLHKQARVERFHSRHSVRTTYRITPEEEKP